MKTPQQAFFIISFMLFPAIVLAGQCPVPGDYQPCDNTVNISELMDYVNEWYKCSACVPDMFQAIEAYYNIPFCGDAKCNGAENCTTCLADCFP